MQGGIDLVYFTHFGFQLKFSFCENRLLEENVIHEIREKKYGELVVGDSLIVKNYFSFIDSCPNNDFVLKTL